MDLIMKTTERFDNAVTKLYNAFHKNKLDAFDCMACAVGNICDNNDNWQYYLGGHVTTNDQNIVTNVYQASLREEFYKNGYNQEELSMIEYVFLQKWIGEKHLDKNKDIQFKGLCAVVEYLCELDNIPNVMDYTKLFETENDKPKYQLA